MLSKIVKKESRGTLFGMFSLVGSLGVLLINKLGGYLFDEISHIWPFLITLIAFIAFTLMTLVLGLMGKLNV
jgi:MFS family permease